MFGFTPAGLRLLSDVTAYPGESYRPACVHRLVAVISRAARRLGERSVFRQDGPALWKNVENSLGRLMTQLWQANALNGDTIQQAFSGTLHDASTADAERSGQRAHDRAGADFLRRRPHHRELIRVALA